ncbi:MAG TPA: STAS domain-containing protein [Candidatus Dormibacteraeota bacterium]|nr:STAS domain-containing protein [Candidatus Dormibacteraeota bacterium]
MTLSPQVTPIPVLRAHQDAILDRWIAALKRAGISRPDLRSDADLTRECSELLSALFVGFSSGAMDPTGSGWEQMRSTLRGITLSRGRLGFGPSETVMFVLSLKEPLFSPLDELEPAQRIDAILELNRLVDRLALITSETYQQGREEIIQRQQQEMLELSTPVVKLWDGVLALPLIGTLDSERTQVVMETLLQAIVETGSTIAIIDITGVPTVDTKVAQHLIQTVSAARLMGADCLISGIRPQIAQTIIHLGITLPDVVTKATLADAFITALGRIGQHVVAKRTDQER